MNYNIEWLFEEVYKIKKLSSEPIRFISDWDVQGEAYPEFANLLSNVYNESNTNSLKYNYAYEQFALKEQVLNTANQNSECSLKETEVTITPSATLSIYLTAHALVELEIKRILVITPAYFTTHESFDKAGCHVFYYHLRDENGLKIDFPALETIIKEQRIEGIVFTDPVYSAGIEFSTDVYLKLAKLCNIYGVYFIVDYSLGGLNWNDSTNSTLNREKVSIVKSCQKFLFIDTLSKRLLMNGIKFSVILGDEDIIDKIDLISETVYGGLSSAQCFLIRDLYKPENSGMIDIICRKNAQSAQQNHSLVKSLLIGTDFQIVNTNSGYFSIVNYDKCRIEDIDTKRFSLDLLKNQKILCITKDRFTYFAANQFGFRINLNKKMNELMPLIEECIQMDIKRYKTK